MFHNAEEDPGPKDRITECLANHFSWGKGLLGFQASAQREG